MPEVITPAYPISIERVKASRLPSVDLKAVPFGSVFTDHMFVADFDGQQWTDARIVPYENMSISPAFSGLHYGQSIFEGMKAYRDQNGHVRLFRPEAHLERLNRSGARLAMPEIPMDLFIEGLRQFVKLDSDWVDSEPGSQLYIRPIYFATDGLLGMRASTAYRLMIIACPANAYYKEPVRVHVTDKYVRAASGGVGNVKMAGNYARTMQVAKEKAALGFHVVLWLDAVNRVNIEEFSTMNAFFVIGDSIITPRLTGTILEGITRESAITLLNDAGFSVEERDISIHEIMAAGRNGTLREAFGTGTAAVVSPVALLHYDGQDMALPPSNTWKVCPFINETLRRIRIGELPDTHGWMRDLD